MKAQDVMTRHVVSVSPETPTEQVARLLLENGISAVPVLDAEGAPVGMVSEGDLIGRNDPDREARRDWWLTLLAEGEALSDEFLKTLRGSPRSAREVMSTPLVTVTETTDVTDIARLLTAQRIKRAPVVRDGRVIGIVSRADLLRALGGKP
jgi:CBS domain-containing protein